jgi:hypothetical protein
MPTLPSILRAKRACLPRAKTLGLALLALGLLSTTAYAQRVGSVVVRVPVDAAALPSGTHTVDLGGVFVGESAHHEMTFVNQTAAETSITAVRVGHGSGLSFSADNCTGRTLAPRQSCTVRASATVSEVGVYLAGAQIVHSANAVPDVWHFRAMGLARMTGLGAAPRALDFGVVPVGATSAAQAVRLTNEGSEALEISSLFVQGRAAHWRVDARACLGTLAPGAHCDALVQLAPSVNGEASAHLHAHVAGEGFSALATLAGSGGAGAPRFAPTLVQWTNAAIGTDEPARRVSLTNAGNATLALGVLGEAGAALALDGDAAFRIQATDCPATLAPGAACTLDLTVRVPDAQPRTASLRLLSGATQIAHVELFAQGAATVGGAQPEGALSVWPSPLEIAAPAGQRRTRTFELYSVGAEPVRVTGYQLNSPAGATFEILNPENCIGVLPVGHACSLEVAFSSPTVGAWNTSLVVLNSSVEPEMVVPVRGEARLPGLEVSSHQLDFGSVRVGSFAYQSLALQNASSLPIALFQIFTSSWEFNAMHNCPAELPPGGQCVIDVSFYAGWEGHQLGQLVIEPEHGSGLVVALAGAGVMPAGPTLSTSSLDFGSVPIGTTSQPQVVVLLNEGSDELLLDGAWSSGGEFSASHDCPSALPAGQACHISVVFTPGVLGPAGDSRLSIWLRDGRAFHVQLQGSGNGPPSLQVDESTLNFGVLHEPGAVFSHFVWLRATGAGTSYGPITVTGSSFALEPWTGSWACQLGGGRLWEGSGCRVLVRFTKTRARMPIPFRGLG